MSSLAQSLVYLGGFLILMLTVLQGMRILKGGKFSSNFAKLFGLITLAVLATIIAVQGIPEEARTPLFTLFGTIAGYLAGSKTSAATVPDGAKINENGL
ncbi:hypothetical protein SAMN04488570_1372 [Nocardioides scoriae]|uniref:Holin n=1 Tax=Nocardioides scoriae TaxID=642780 RepID=A0A1H1QBR2_9ACTN|nr:hypothetical protein [Nocardioides scoriae]SDS20932.1 hypothetical protein SAMN04488570_1372 [Nocardioides scoriae]